MCLLKRDGFHGPSDKRTHVFRFKVTVMCVCVCGCHVRVTNDCCGAKRNLRVGKLKGFPDNCAKPGCMGVNFKNNLFQRGNTNAKAQIGEIAL